MTEVGNGDLSGFAGVVRERDPLVEAAGLAVDTANIGKSDLAPDVHGRGEEVGSNPEVRRRRVGKAMPGASSRPGLVRRLSKTSSPGGDPIRVRQTSATWRLPSF